MLKLRLPGSGSACSKSDGLANYPMLFCNRGGFLGGPDREEGCGAEDLTFMAKSLWCRRRTQLSPVCHPIAAQTIHARRAAHPHSPLRFDKCGTTGSPARKQSPRGGFHHLPSPPSPRAEVSAKAESPKAPSSCGTPAALG